MRRRSLPAAIAHWGSGRLGPAWGSCAAGGSVPGPQRGGQGTTLTGQTVRTPLGAALEEGARVFLGLGCQPPLCVQQAEGLVALAWSAGQGPGPLGGGDEIGIGEGPCRQVGNQCNPHPV